MIGFRDMGWSFYLALHITLRTKTIRLRQHLVEIAAQTEPIASSRCNTRNENLYYYSVCRVMLSEVLAGSVASPLEVKPVTPPPSPRQQQRETGKTV